MNGVAEIGAGRRPAESLIKATGASVRRDELVDSYNSGPSWRPHVLTTTIH